MWSLSTSINSRPAAMLLVALMAVAHWTTSFAQAPKAQSRQMFSSVATPSQLREAIDRGDVHIEITSHMVLSEDILPRNDEFIFTPKPSTQSIVGHCPKELPSWSQALQPPVVARDGDQCLLLAERNLFFWDNTAGSDTHTVWMHNMYLRLQRTYRGTPVGPRAALIFWRPGAPGPETDKSKLFLTSSVLQGDGIAGSRPFWSQHARSLLSRVQIRDGNEDSVVFAYNAPVALSNTQFHGNNCTDGMIGGTFVSAGVIKIGSVTSVRLGDSSSMTTTEGWEVLLEEKNSSLYTDTMPNGAERPRANPASKGQVLPLSELPAQYTPRTAFLTLDDEDYKRIKQAEESAAKNAEALDRATENSSQTPSGGGGGDGGLSDGVVGAIAGTVGFIALVLIVSATAILLSRRHGRAKDESDLKATEGGGYPARPYSLSTPSALKASQRSIDQSLSNSDPRRNRSVSSTEWTSLRALELGTPGTVGGSLLGRSYARGTASSITGGADATAFTMASLSSEATMAGGTWRQQLLRALNNMRVARPPQPFAGRYLLLRERAGGGQAVIAFARDREGGYFQYAVKFFRRLEDFEIEAAFYRHPRIRGALPQVFHGGDNTDRALVSPGGFVYPPFLVLERGSSLPKWMEEPRGFPSVLNMFHDLAMQLDVVHSSGYVHRDLKPGNVLLMLQTQCWKLIDFGIAAKTGVESPAHCTVAYAAPEVLIAYERGGLVVVDPAQDIWALGCLIYECLTESPVVDPYHSQAMAVATARGEALYPWEEAGDDENPMFARSRARDTVLACLSRDPSQRPTAKALLRFIDRMGTTGTGDTAMVQPQPHSLDASPAPPTSAGGGPASRSDASQSGAWGSSGGGAPAREARAYPAAGPQGGLLSSGSRPTAEQGHSLHEAGEAVRPGLGSQGGGASWLHMP